MNITMNILVANAGGGTVGTGTFPVLLPIIIIVAVAMIVLQIFLSRKENKWLGFILPIITFCFSLIAVLNFVATTGKDTPADVLGIFLTFLLYNIPTAILLVIYAACKGNRKKQRDLEKMSVQDLQ